MTQSTADERREFLGRMYDQLFNDINTHILVVWQSVGTLVAAFAVLALVEKAILSLDVAATIIVLISGWLLWHLEDASYWYNRNLVMIANIERQFLWPSDLRDIHYYFGKHRKSGTMIDHLRIQRALGLGIAGIVLIDHFVTRVLPWLTGGATVDAAAFLPYVVAIASAIWVAKLKARFKGKYVEFLQNSPGIDVDTAGIEYGIGHPAQETPAAPRSGDVPGK